MKFLNLTTRAAVTALLLSGLLLAGGVRAEQQQAIEPEVTVRHEAGHTLHEYRVNGLLYMIKVVPEKGRPYYLIDPEGVGNYIRVDKSDLLIPSWIVHSW